ncbi:MAG: hypothetical protein AAF557_21170 [Pseudomonadota bacterium]
MIFARCLALAILLMAPLPVWAMGFHAKDLWGVRLKTSVFLGGSYEAESYAPNRVTLHCRDCDGLVIVDILLTQGEDSQEAKLRSGEMTIPAMQEGCTAWAESCSLRAHAVGGAIGWVEDYIFGGRAGTTARLYLDGEMLMIRSTAPVADIAHGNGRAAIEKIAPLIVEGP